MFVTETAIRIHYALTDQMGVVYYGHYAQFYEIGRTEAIRQIGYTYKEIEAMGIIMPVVSINSKFLRPAKYDDMITVRTTLKTLPDHHEISFFSEIFNEAGKLLNTGEVVLYFVDAQTMRRRHIPEQLREKLAPFFEG